MTLISALVPSAPFDTLTGTIVDLTEPVEYVKDGKTGERQRVLLKDESGQVVLTLWGDDCRMRLKKGMVVSIQNGWCSEWKGEKQVAIGRYGFLQVDDV